jgi:hypothetical protein
MAKGDTNSPSSRGNNNSSPFSTIFNNIFDSKSTNNEDIVDASLLTVHEEGEGSVEPASNSQNKDLMLPTTTTTDTDVDDSIYEI